MSTNPATHANESSHALGHDFTLLDAADEAFLEAAPEPVEDVEAPSHPLATIKETVKVVRKRKVITTTCGPFRI